MSFRKRYVRLAAAVCAATLLAACGGGDEAETGDSASPGSDSNSASLEAFNAKIDEHLEEAAAPQTERPPTDGPAAQPNKKVFVVPCAMVAQGCADSAKAGVEAGEVLGWDVTLIDPAGDPTKQNNAIGQAVSQNADGIFLTAIDSPTVAASLKRAQGAGLKVVCFACNDPSNSYDALVPHSPDDAFQSGYTAMAALYNLTDRDLNVIMVNGPEYGIATGEKGRQPGAKAFIDECREAGGSCNIATEVEILTANFTTTVPGQVVSAARANPEANALWGFADPTLAFIIPALQQANIKLKTAGVDPIPYNFDLIREGEWEQASVTPSLTWVGYAAMDNLNRMFAGQEPVDQNVRGKLITTENVPDSGVFEGDFDIKPLYREMWAGQG